MLSTEEFQAFAKNYVMFSNVMTRIPGRKNDDLLSKKGGSGFPYVVGMDASGRVLAKLKERSVAGFQKMMDEAKASLEMRKQKDLPIDKKLELLAFDFEVGSAGTAEVEAALKWEGVTDAQKKMLGGMLVDAEVKAHMQGVGSREQAAAVGEKFAAMAKAGKKPSNPGLARSFWGWQLMYAEMNKKPEVFEAAMPGYLALFARHPQIEQIKQNMQKKLDELKQAAEAGGSGG